MYQRTPDTLEDALTMIKATLGAIKMAEAVGVTDSLVQKWTNPHHASKPSIEQALLLDVACAAASGNAPVLALFQKRLGSTVNHPTPLQNLQTEMLQFTAATGALAQKVTEVTCKKGPGGSEMTPNEAKELLHTAKDAENQLRDIQHMASQKVLAQPATSGKA